MIWENNKYYLTMPVKHPNFTIKKYNEFVEYLDKRKKFQKIAERQYDAFLARSLSESSNSTMYIRASIWTWE